MFVLDMLAPLVRYVSRSWAVDSTPKHGLDPKQLYHYLKNRQDLCVFESAALEPGYSVGRSDL